MCNGLLYVYICVRLVERIDNESSILELFSNYSFHLTTGIGYRYFKVKTKERNIAIHPYVCIVSFLIPWACE